MPEEVIMRILTDIEGSLVDIEMKSPRISIIEMDNLRTYISKVKKEILGNLAED